MKNLLILILLVQFNLTFAQDPVVIDMVTIHEVDNLYENGDYYIKDISGFMDDYVGTWSYVDGNTEFRITFEKVEMYHHYYEFTNSTTNYFTDGLYLSYQKIENGTIVFSSPEYGIPPFSTISEFGKLHTPLIDFERNESGFPADFNLQLIGSEYQMLIDINTYNRRNTYFDEHPNEPFLSVPNNILMTKM